MRQNTGAMARPRSPLHTVLDGIWFRKGEGAASKAELAAFERLGPADRDFAQHFEQGLRLGPKSGWAPDMGGISTRNLALLAIDELRKLCQAIATLDAILSPESEWRYYSFNNKWAEGVTCASMRNGSGDDFFIHFSAAGALIKGFAHEYLMSPWSRISQSYHNGAPGHWPGVTDTVPLLFREALQEPAFTWEATTFCIWRTYDDNRWCVGDIDFPAYSYWRRPDGIVEVGSISDPDGSNFLLSILDGKSETYKEFADEYFVQEDGAPSDYPLQIIQHVLGRLPLTDEVVRRLNPKIALDALAEEIYETIGYPRDNA
jgi:hypothetical protein